MSKYVPVMILAAMIALAIGVAQNLMGQQVGPSPAPKPPTATPPSKTSSTRPSPQPSVQDGDNHNNETQAAQPPDPPPIVFRPERLDLGTLRPNQSAKGSVDILNTSNQTIRIQSSRASCTCTSVNLADTVVAPGQSVRLPMEFHGESRLGTRHVSVRVLVEGFRDFAEVKMSVTIALPVRAEPSTITSLKDATTGEIPLTGIITLSSEDHKPFQILSVQGGPPSFADFDPVKDQIRDRYQLKWDLTKYNQSTCADGNGVPMPLWLAVETDHPDCGVVDVEIRHECTKRTYYKPGDAWILDERRLNIGRVKPGQTVNCIMHARWIPKASHDMVPVMITSESSKFNVQMTGITPAEGGFEIHLKINVGTKDRGLIYGNMRVHSQIQQWPVMVIGTIHE